MAHSTGNSIVHNLSGKSSEFILKESQVFLIRRYVAVTSPLSRRLLGDACDFRLTYFRLTYFSMTFPRDISASSASSHMESPIFNETLLIKQRFGLWAMGYGLWPMAHGLWPMGYGLWAMSHGLWVMSHGLWAMGYGPWAMGYVPWAMVYGLCPMGYGLWASNSFVISLLFFF